jgi:hypothetical protein
MKKRFLTGRGFLAAAILAAGAGAAGLWAVPAYASGTPQISVVSSHSGALPVTLGHPRAEATAAISPSYVAYNPANGDEAVVSFATVGPTESAHVYLIAGANEANEYHIETSNIGPTFGSLVKGTVYLVAGNGPAGLTMAPGYGTTAGMSPTPAATQNGIAPISVTFDNVGNLLIGEAHTDTGPTQSGIQMVAKTTGGAAYGYGSVTAGNLYTIAGVGTAVTSTPAIEFGSQVEAFSLSVDAAGDIIDGAAGAVVFINEQSFAITRYGKTLPADSATTITGTAVHGGATCGGGAHNVPALGHTSPNLEFPHPYVDKHGNVYVNDNRVAATGAKGCTWVLPAATGTLDGQHMTGGRLYSLTGAANGTAYSWRCCQHHRIPQLGRSDHRRSRQRRDRSVGDDPDGPCDRRDQRDLLRQGHGCW